MQFYLQCGYSSEEIYELFKKYAKKIKYFDFNNILKTIYGIIFKRKIIIKGFNNGKIIEQIINKASNEKGFYKINEIKMPVLITSVNLHSADIICFCSKENRNMTFSNNYIYINDVNIGTAVRASCSYPAVFEPCIFKNMELIDGGVRENIPWKEIKKMGAEKVINVVFSREVKKECCNNIFDVVGRSLKILNYELSQHELNGSDYLLKIQTKEIGLLDTKELDNLYKIGYKTAKEKIKEIKKIIYK